jgi:hypothetical protein
MGNNPMITIETPFTRVSIPVNELNAGERSSLAQLLGISGARKTAFEELRALRKFRRLRKEDVWSTCPKGTRFDVEVEVILTNDTPRGKADCSRITALVPEAECSAATHRAFGWCPACNREHVVLKPSVLVKLDVEGVPLSNLYEV